MATDDPNSREHFRAEMTERDRLTWKTIIRGIKIAQLVDQLRADGHDLDADRLIEAMEQDGITATYLRLQDEWCFPRHRMHMDRTCSVCGVEFSAIRRDAVTCSDRCRQRRRRHTSREPTSQEP